MVDSEADTEELPPTPPAKPPAPQKRKAAKPVQQLDLEAAAEAGDCSGSGSEDEKDAATDGGVAEKKGGKRPSRQRVFLTKSAMETLSNPKTGAYKLMPQDMECSRQIRMFALAARRERNSPYIKNGSIEVELQDGSIHTLPVNGRSAPRYPGAAALRGKVLLQTAQKIGISAASASFFKDFGFGAKTALGILKASGQCVRDAESERAALMTQAQDQIADLSLAGPPEDSPSSSSSQ